MSNYFDKNLTDGEYVEMEIKHNRLVIVQTIFSFIIWLAISIALHIAANYLFDYINGLVNGEADINWVLILLRVIIWGLFALVGVLLPVATIIGVYSSKLAITNRRLIGKRGFFSIESLDYPIDKIDSVMVNVSFFGRILHYSEIVIKSANTGGGTDDTYGDNGISFEGVANANEFRNTLTEAIARHQDAARKAQANEIANAMKNSGI